VLKLENARFSKYLDALKTLIKKQHPNNFSRGYLMSGSVT